MPLLSAFWRSINKKARVVVSLRMRLMAWSIDDDETALYNFGDFSSFHTDKKEVKEIRYFGI